MHICPQEIMATLMMFDMVKPYVGVVAHWCESCVTGVHKNCQDHAADNMVVEATEENV